MNLIHTCWVEDMCTVVLVIIELTGLRRRLSTSSLLTITVNKSSTVGIFSSSNSRDRSANLQTEQSGIRLIQLVKKTYHDKLKKNCFQIATRQLATSLYVWQTRLDIIDCPLDTKERDQSYIS